MKPVTRIVPILASALSITSAGAIFAAGCGGGNSPSPSDGGAPDATIDGQSEDVVNQDAVGSNVEGGPGTDAGSSDADAAATSDADAGASSDADAGIDGSSLLITVTAETFPGQLAATLCSTIANCCGTSGDAATFNWQACYNSKLAAGYNGSNTGVTAVDGGNTAFNAAQAQTCLNTIAAADCSSNQITAAEQGELYKSCFGAYAGTQEAGSPCAGSTDCAPGGFCSPVDGGLGDAGAIGLCAPLVGQGGGCGILGGQALGQTVCSYRGAASNGLFCQNIAGDAGETQLSPSAWTCQPQWAVGAECYTNQDCASFICHQVGTTADFQCASAGNWANANTCSTYAVIVDAGGGG
jgi:hypothetical protein